jgi:glycerol-3-phosphate dehydrogenase
MDTTPITKTVAIIGGGVVGAAVLHALAHRGVDAILLEAESGLAYGASGTNSGVLHTGFDSTPGSLETELILRAAALRGDVIAALGVPLVPTGAVLVPRRQEERETIQRLAENAATNGVEVHVREADGALIVPGESITDPVAFTIALGRSAVHAGARIEVSAKVVGIDDRADHLTIRLEDGRTIDASYVINCAGLHADDMARLVGDDSFEIYPRKGEFFVFDLPAGEALEHILLPVPTKRTKGVLVFPTLDGRVVAGPTAIDLLDKDDWSVRPEASAEILDKAAEQLPALRGLAPIMSYAGLRPAGRDTNYVIAPSPANRRLINVAAIRSTGLSASLGIGEYVTDLLEKSGVTLGEQIPATPAGEPDPGEPWWQRTAHHRRNDRV